MNTPTVKPVLKRFPVQGTIDAAIEAFFDTMTELRDELQEANDNTPESLQGGEVFSAREDAIASIETFCDEDHDLPEAPDGAPEASEVAWVENRRRSATRSDRRDNAVNALDAAISGLEELVAKIDEAVEKFGPESDAGEFEDYSRELETFKGQLEDWKSEADGVDFPGRSG